MAKRKTDRTKTYDARFVLDRTDELRTAAGDRNTRMDRFERMYRMDVWDDAPLGPDDIRLSLPIAFDMVEKMRALLITRPPVISVPWGNNDPDDQAKSQRMERYLYGLSGRANLGRVLADAEWFAMCLGMGVLKIAYDSQAVEGDSPLVIVAPDPRTIFGRLAPARDRWVELAQVWDRTRSEIIDEWGADLDMPSGMDATEEIAWLDEEVEYIEYWREMTEWIEPEPVIEMPTQDSVIEATIDNVMAAMAGSAGSTGSPTGDAANERGAQEILDGIDSGEAVELDIKDEPEKIRVRRVLHMVVVRDGNTGKPEEGGIVVKDAVIVPGYSQIPYIKWSGIATPLGGGDSDLSILYALGNGDGGSDSYGILQAWNLLASLDMGEALNAANPPLETDDEKATINAHAGEITTVQKDRHVRPLREPGQSLAFSRMSEQMSRMVDRIGLPEIWSGMVQNLSGQAISGLATAFTMLIGFKQLDRERALENLLMLALALTREYAPDDGWMMYGENAYGRSVEETLKPTDIAPHPRVRVKLSASMPKDDMAFISMLVQLVNTDLLSYETALDHIQKTIGLSADTPEEEIERILRAKLLLKSDVSQQLAKVLALRSAKRMARNAGEDEAMIEQLLGIQPQGQGQPQGLPQQMPPQGMQQPQGAPPPTMGLPPNVLPPSPDLLAGAGRIPQANNLQAGMNLNEVLQ
jgi:hypothetical protein